MATRTKAAPAAAPKTAAPKAATAKATSTTTKATAAKAATDEVDELIERSRVASERERERWRRGQEALA